MPRRYLFLCPDRQSASGGITVIYDTVITLRNAGYDAIIVHSSSRAVAHPDHAEPPPTLYTHAIIKKYLRYSGKREAIRIGSKILIENIRSGRIHPLCPCPNDIIITPEFMMVEAIESFPQNPICVFVQGARLFLEAFQKAKDRGIDVKARCTWFLAGSKLCARPLELLGLEKAFYVPVSMKPEDFPYSQKKSPLITYMPRRRPWEAKLIVDALARRGNIKGYQVAQVDGLPRKIVSQRLQESRFFISLMKDEGFGFPAAEAMAAGCITIGFTGFGSEEYFDASTGVPVPEGDIVGLVETIEKSVVEYETDPTRLDAMRLQASELIHSRYTHADFEKALLKAWSELDASPDTFPVAVSGRRK